VRILIQVFHLTYIGRELRRRLGRTLLTALGLALGVGLVIGIIGVSQGLDDAQARVLAPLQSVGTDVLVTRVVGAPAATGSGSTTATTSTTVVQGRGGGGGGGGFFGGGGPGGFGGPGGANAVNQADAAAVLNENRNVVTDLAALGKPGDQFTRDFFLSATLLSFPQDAIAQVAGVRGVKSAVGGLVQLAEHQTGTVPQIVASIQTGGQTVTQTVRPDPMTPEERQAFRDCIQAKGVQIGPAAGGGAAAPAPAPGAGDGGGGGGGGIGRGFGNPAFDDCLPQRFREFRAQFTTPLQTIRQVVNPPTTDITSQSYTAAGIDPANPAVGLVTSEQLTGGRWVGRDAPAEVLLNIAYANSHSLKVGSTLQKLAGKDGRVTQVLVKVDSAGSVDRVTNEVRKLLPGAEVVTTKALADQVTGSLADTRKLANRIGGVLAAIVLAAAFAIAALLTLSSIAKRVREIGTLRAIGWSKARVVRQLLGETIGIGLLGGLLGVAAGIGVSAAVDAASASLTASTSGVPGVAGSSLSGFFGQATSAVRTTHVTLSAPIHASTLALGVVFALVGGLLAGIVGGWRAARLAPVVALRDLG